VSRVLLGFGVLTSALLLWGSAQAAAFPSNLRLSELSESQEAHQRLQPYPDAPTPTPGLPPFPPQEPTEPEPQPT
jgi:hypothetical protein